MTFIELIGKLIVLFGRFRQTPTTIKVWIKVKGSIRKTVLEISFRIEKSNRLEPVSKMAAFSVAIEFSAVNYVVSVLFTFIFVNRLDVQLINKRFSSAF